MIDVAILVLATAIGLCAIRPFLASFVEAPKVLENGRWVTRWWDPVVLLNRAVLLEVVLMAWSVGWLVLQLRQPRPRIRRLIRQPGFLATFSPAIVLLISGPITAAVLASSYRSGNISSDYWLLFETWAALVSLQSGAAVVAGWALLAIGRQCRPVSGWLEWVGVCAGVIWVAMIPANLILPFWYLL